LQPTGCSACAGAKRTAPLNNSSCSIAPVGSRRGARATRPRAAHPPDAGGPPAQRRVLHQDLFPQLSEALADRGAEADLTAPLMPSFGQIGEPRLFDRNETKLEILATTRCCADAGSRSGDEIRRALRRGAPMTWKFNPTEKRGLLVMPEMLGGQNHLLCLAASNTFTAKPEDAGDRHGARTRDRLIRFDGPSPPNVSSRASCPRSMA
jgi:hypothetical protein